VVRISLFLPLLILLFSPSLFLSLTLRFLASDDVEEHGTGSAAFDERKKVINLVIRRLIKTEGRLIVVDNHDGPNEEKTLRLHPSDHIFANE
jgi:hypothetical protein